VTPVVHPNDIIGAILLLHPEFQGPSCCCWGWVDGASQPSPPTHPPTHPQAPIEFYRLLVCITSNTVVLNYLPIPQTLNMCCSYKIHHKRRQQRQRWLAGWLAGWLGGPAKERDDDQVASTSPEMSSVPLSVLPCIIIHQRPYPCSHVSAQHVCAIMCSTKLDG